MFDVFEVDTTDYGSSLTSEVSDQRSCYPHSKDLVKTEVGLRSPIACSIIFRMPPQALLVMQSLHTFV